MKNFTFYDSLRNQTGKTKRWLALLMFCGVLLLGQIGFAFLLPNIKEATNNEIVSTEAYSENTVSNNDGMPDSWANAVEDSSFDCSQISESTASGDGYGLGGLNNQDLAGDFIVSDGTTLVVDMVKVSVNTSSVANFNIIFWSDNNGLPDTVLYTINNVTSTNPVLSSGGYYMHTLDISFQNPWFNATGGDTRYWLQVTTPSAGGWERRLNTLSLGVDDAYRQNNGTWNTIYTDPPLDLYNLVYEVLGECVDCTPPSSLTATQTSTEVTLGWTGSGDSYDVEWGLNGFTLGEGTQITGLTTNSTVLDITTLDNGIYQFYVAQSCGDGEMSVWTGPFSLE